MQQLTVPGTAGLLLGRIWLASILRAALPPIWNYQAC